MTTSKVSGMSGVKDSVVILSMRLLTIVITIAVQSCLAWFLAPAGRGSFGVCITFASMMSVVFSFGTDRAMQYYVISKRHTVAEGIVIALILVLIGSSAAILCGWFLIDSSLEFFQKASRTSFQQSLLLIPLLMANTSLQLVLSARRHFAAAGISILLGAAINGPAIIALVGAADLGVPGAVSATLLSQFATMVFCLAALRRYEKIRLVAAPSGAYRAIFSYGARYYLARLGVSINAHLPLLLLASFASSEEIGWFVLASVLMERVFLIPNSISEAIRPRIGASPEGRPELVAQSARMLAVVVGMCLVILVVPSGLFVPILFSPAFAASVPILWILAAGILIRSATRPMVMYFIGINRPGITSCCTMVQLIVIIVALPWFYKVGGIHGAGWAIVAGQSLEGLSLTVAFRVISKQSFLRIWVPRSSDFRIVKASIWAALGKTVVPRVYTSLQEADRHRENADSRQIIILDDKVIKRQNPERAQIELEKTKQGAEIGKQCNWFRAPEILGVDIRTGEIRFEKFRNLVPLWYVLRRRGDTDNLLVHAGRSLAAIHNQMNLPESMIQPTSRRWGEATVWPTVFLHGDFNTFNVLIDAKTDQIRIIDWAVTDSCTPEVGTYGPCYFDLAWFIHTLHMQRYLGLDRIRQIDEKVGIFLDAYFKDAEHGCNPEGLRNYLCNVYLPASSSVPSLNLPLWERLLKCRYTLVSASSFRRFVRRFTGCSLAQRALET